jgi:hypothetical protein
MIFRRSSRHSRHHQRAVGARLDWTESRGEDRRFDRQFGAGWATARSKKADLLAACNATEQTLIPQFEIAVDGLTRKHIQKVG